MQLADFSYRKYSVFAGFAFFKLVSTENTRIFTLKVKNLKILVGKICILSILKLFLFADKLLSLVKFFSKCFFIMIKICFFSYSIIQYAPYN